MYLVALFGGFCDREFGICSRSNSEGKESGVLILITSLRRAKTLYTIYIDFGAFSNLGVIFEIRNHS